MLKELRNLAGVLEVAEDKQCQQCGKVGTVQRVYVTNFFGHGSHKWLCTACAILEKGKKY